MSTYFSGKSVADIESEIEKFDKELDLIESKKNILFEDMKVREFCNLMLEEKRIRYEVSNLISYLPK